VAIPDFQTVMLPLVEALADGRERTLREITDELAGRFGLTEQERIEVLPSGQQSIFSNRIGWAKSHLKYAGLLENPARGLVSISELGRKVLAENPQAINVKFLRRFPSYC
jgi:restriction system protein